MSQQPHSIFSLDKGVILHIVEYLDGKSLSNFGTTCRTLNKISKENPLWKTLCRSTWKIQNIFFEPKPQPSSLPVQGQTDNNNLSQLANGVTKDDKSKQYFHWRNVFVDTHKHENMKWKLNQVFGEDPSAVNEENVITAVQFDSSGEFLAIGYQCGQVVIFRNTTGDTFKFFTQFESHHPEFDFLTSLEIEEKINKIKWVKNKYPNNSRLILTTNDKTIKLWKLFERKQKLSSRFSGLNLDSENQPQEVTATPEAKQRKVFANAHAYNINSISLCSDGELFMSADDLRINLWNLEISSECFTFVDIKPTNMNELSEVITSATFHPIDSSQFAYSSSKGIAYLADTRVHSLCDKTVRSFREKGGNNKSFFSEVTSSISDIQFSHDGRYLLARDYLHLKVWDVNMDSEPVAIYNVHDHIKPKLYELYENDIIFDKFECSYSNNDLHIITGSYSNNFMVFDLATNQVKHLQAVNPRDRRKRRQNTPSNAPVTEDINFDEKVTHMSWSPSSDLVAWLLEITFIFIIFQRNRQQYCNVHFCFK